MLTKIILATALFAICTVTTFASIGGYISDSDRHKLLTVLTKSLVVEDNDITNSYYGAKGFKLLNEQLIPILVRKNCDNLQLKYKPDLGPEATYQVLNAWNFLGCAGKIHTDVTINNAKTVLESDKSTIADLRYAAEVLKLTEQAVTNGAKVAQLAQGQLREDDSLQNLGHALHLGALLGNAGKFALDRVEEVIVQADEVDGKLLQWEGGLTITSLLISGIVRLPGAKLFTQEQSEKLAAYLLTRRTVQTPKGALALIEAAQFLTIIENSPVSITIDGPPIVSLDKPELKLHVSNILNKPLRSPPTPVVAQSATRITDDVVVLSKQPLTPGANSLEYVLPLKLEPGQYRIALTAGSHSTTLTVRVLGPITLEWLELGLSDADGSSAPRLTKLQYPNKLPNVLQADASQNLNVKFSISRLVHQAFLRLYTNKKEIIFVAEPDNKVYKIEVNLAAELTHSGNFQMELILGDSVINNPVKWGLGTIEVNLNAPEPVPKSLHVPKPEIQHLFRPAEKTPPEAVSLLFTALTLSPLLILLGLWAKLGINCSNFTGLAIPFHLGFGGILGLFTLFWLKLDMFKTCAWLIPVGGFTFLAGQKLLSSIAKKKV